MTRPRGSVALRKGVLKARVTYADPRTGQRREIERAVQSKTEGREFIERKIRELTMTNGRSGSRDRARFRDLADFYAEIYIRPAEYHDGRKVGGLRGLASARSRLAALVDYFGSMPLKAITYADVFIFKSKRLATPTTRRVPRAIASVHRELELLRRMLSVAVREGWIVANPYTAGDCLITKADERQREMVLSLSEEQRLLACCEGERRKHLRPIVICAIDTGMRLGEILKLQWRDVDLSARTIRIVALNTKTFRERTVAMTTRLREELTALAGNGLPDPERLVFGVAATVKRSFVAARTEAGLAGLRFHDLRHTAATRLASGHLPLTHVGRILGHTQPSTTYRYVNATAETAREAASILDAFNAGATLS
jgi:integrase